VSERTEWADVSGRTKRLRLGLAGLIGALGALAVEAPASANGNHVHLWVAVDAVGSVDDAELADLLAEPELLETLRNGANFPDGGYAVGDGYGEMGHWEPFQKRYLEWIRDNYGPPWSDEGKKHVAFLLGMAAHGMTDQLFDGMYLERHYVFDENSASAEWGNIDGVTDVCFAAKVGPVQPPETWVPADVLAELFAEAGHQVAAATIETGQSLVAVAVMYSNDKSSDEGTVSKYMELYPWACSRMDDPLVPGAPVTMGPAIAKYWEELWARLNGDESFAQPLLGTWFGKGEPWEQPRDAGSPDSWVSFAMPRGIDKGTLTEQSVAIVGPGGIPHPVTLQLYYGHASHLVNVRPNEDWAEAADYTVTISAPLASWDGAVLEGTREFAFSTGPAPSVEDVGLDGDALGGDAIDTDARESGSGKDAAGSGPCIDGTGKACGHNSASGCSVGGVGGMRGGTGGVGCWMVLLAATVLAIAALVARRAE
jgi:hypothetical protein